jgi:hypothetical protein
MAKNTAPNHKKPSVQKQANYPPWADRSKTINALKAHGEMMRKESEMKAEMGETKKPEEET